MTTHSTRQPGHLVGLSKAHSIHVYGMVAYNYHKNAPFMQVNSKYNYHGSYGKRILYNSLITILAILR